MMGTALILMTTLEKLVSLLETTNKSQGIRRLHTVPVKLTKKNKTELIQSMS